MLKSTLKAIIKTFAKNFLKSSKSYFNRLITTKNFFNWLITAKNCLNSSIKSWLKTLTKSWLKTLTKSCLKTLTKTKMFVKSFRLKTLISKTTLKIFCKQIFAKKTSLSTYLARRCWWNLLFEKYNVSHFRQRITTLISIFKKIIDAIK